MTKKLALLRGNASRPAKRLYDECDRTIAKGLDTFVEVGHALAVMRDSGLFRHGGFKTFEAYLKSRHQLARARAYQLIAAAATIERVHGRVQTEGVSEFAIRPITLLPAGDQAKAFDRAIELAGGETPTSRHTRQAVDEVLDKVGEIYDASRDGPPPLEEEIEEIEPEPHRMSGMFRSDSVERYTPRHIVDAVLATFGGKIDLDPCSNPTEPWIIPAERRFTIEDDGLSQPWDAEALFLNPPYGDEIGEWIQKLRVEYSGGRTKEAIALVAARTDTQWWRAFPLDAPACFIEGRLRFLGPEHEELDSAGFPSAVFLLSRDPERFNRFVEVFKGLGDVWERCT